MKTTQSLLLGDDQMFAGSIVTRLQTLSHRELFPVFLMASFVERLQLSWSWLEPGAISPWPGVLVRQHRPSVWPCWLLSLCPVSHGHHIPGSTVLRSRHWSRLCPGQCLLPHCLIHVAQLQQVRSAPSSLSPAYYCHANLLTDNGNEWYLSALSPISQHAPLHS